MSDRAIEAMNKQIGRALADLRREKDLRQEDVANECGISRSSLANIEKGRQPVSLALLYKISEALQVDDARSILPRKLPLAAEKSLGIAAMTKVESTEDVSDRENELVQRIVANSVQGQR